MYVPAEDTTCATTVGNVLERLEVGQVWVRLQGFQKHHGRWKPCKVTIQWFEGTLDMLVLVPVGRHVTLRCLTRGHLRAGLRALGVTLVVPEKRLYLPR